MSLDQRPSTAATSVDPPHATPDAPWQPARQRGVERVLQGQATRDGDGVRLVRVLTADLQRRLDPFLMLDVFGSEDPRDVIGGFPDHPHRGFETVTLMLAGRMRHRDSAGNSGLLTPGSVQWMTAGRGVIHSEMPEQHEGRMHGFQLWLNLPASDKLCAPWYRDIRPEELPVLALPGVRATVVAGHSHGVAGAVQRARTEPLYLLLELAPGAAFAQPLAPAFNALAYVDRGSVVAGGRELRAGRMAIFDNARDSDGIALRAGDAGAALLLLAGRPLNEPIAQYGPFVMNTQEEVFQAVRDFQAGRLAPRIAAG